VVAALWLCLASAASGQDRAERRRSKALAKVAKKLGVSAEALDAVRGERYASRDASDRRKLLEAIGRRPDGRLLPLVVDAARREKDFANRVSAVKLLSTVALEADREWVAERWLPELPRLLSDPQDEVFLGCADAVNTVNRWLGLDHRLVALYERAFAGENYRLAQKAFAGLVELQHPALRAGPAREALLEVLRPKTRFSVFERKRAVLEAGKRGDLRRPGQLATLMFQDGTVAIECVTALTELGDPSVIPALRRVDRTASHKLRIPAYEARAKLGDEALFGELDEAFRSDHPAIQRTLIRGLGAHPSQKAGAVLDRLAEGLEDEALQVEVALARLARGDDLGLPLLEEKLFEDLDKGLARRVMQVEQREAAPLILPLARSEKLGQRGAAVDRLGGWGLGGEEELALLVGLAGEEKATGLRLRAAASLLQLGHPVGVAAVGSALVGLDVVAREDVKTGAGKPARRYRGSVLVDVCQRWAEGQVAAAIPLLAAWLDPPLPSPAPGSEASSAGTRTGGALELPEAPEPPKWLRHQLVRREVVRALGQLAAELDADPALRARARRALVRTLADPAAVVRAEALRGLAALADMPPLPPAASLSEEEATLDGVRVWLARQG
jgi:hypothetical protein